MHPKFMTRYIWKETVEDIHQSNYDPILAELLPSYRLPLGTQAEDKNMVVHRKLSKDELRYPRFMFHEPILKVGKEDMMERTHHFRVRLFEHLPWLAFRRPDNDNDDVPYASLTAGMAEDAPYFDDTTVHGEWGGIVQEIEQIESQ